MDPNEDIFLLQLWILFENLISHLSQNTKADL